GARNTAKDPRCRKSRAAHDDDDSGECSRSREEIRRSREAPPGDARDSAEGAWTESSRHRTEPLRLWNACTAPRPTEKSARFALAGWRKRPRPHGHQEDAAGRRAQRAAE